MKQIQRSSLRRPEGVSHFNFISRTINYFGGRLSPAGGWAMNRPPPAFPPARPSPTIDNRWPAEPAGPLLRQGHHRPDPRRGHPDGGDWRDWRSMTACDADAGADRRRSAWSSPVSGASASPSRSTPFASPPPLRRVVVGK